LIPVLYKRLKTRAQVYFSILSTLLQQLDPVPGEPNRCGFTGLESDQKNTHSVNGINQVLLPGWSAGFIF
jgi:hypothetical protein